MKRKAEEEAEAEDSEAEDDTPKPGNANFPWPNRNTIINTRTYLNQLFTIISMNCMPAYTKSPFLLPNNHPAAKLEKHNEMHPCQESSGYHAHENSLEIR